jgi:hypothetical protein
MFVQISSAINATGIEKVAAECRRSFSGGA